MLADIHPPLEREEGQDDGHDGPEDSRTEAREAAEPRAPHWITLVARDRIAGGISRPNFWAALRLTVRCNFRAFVNGTSAAARPPRIACASSPAWRPMSSPLANDSAKSAPICAWRSESPSTGT